MFIAALGAGAERINQLAAQAQTNGKAFNEAKAAANTPAGAPSPASLFGTTVLEQGSPSSTLMPAPPQVPAIDSDVRQSLVEMGQKIVSAVAKANETYPGGRVPPPVQQTLDQAVVAWRDQFLAQTQDMNRKGSYVRQADSYAFNESSNAAMASMRDMLKNMNKASDIYMFMGQVMAADPAIAGANGQKASFVPTRSFVDFFWGPLSKPAPPPVVVAPPPPPPPVVVAPPPPPPPIPPVTTAQLRGRDMAAVLSGVQGQAIRFARDNDEASIEFGEWDEFGPKKKDKKASKEEIYNSGAKIDLSAYQGQAFQKIDVQLKRLDKEERVRVLVLKDGRQVADFLKDGRGDDRISVDASLLGGNVDASRVTVLIIPEKRTDKKRYNSNFSVTGINVSVGGARL